PILRLLPCCRNRPQNPIQPIARSPRSKAAATAGRLGGRAREEIQGGRGRPRRRHWPRSPWPVTITERASPARTPRSPYPRATSTTRWRRGGRGHGQRTGQVGATGAGQPAMAVDRGRRRLLLG
uniref:Uncharacterized protein n=2 Tax=Aegilops tauschii subsp. strangulata TaxID=200361 RepID=A0A453HXN3_AEGTS